jgi:uncharacterized protein (TIGR02231 family)
MSHLIVTEAPIRRVTAMEDRAQVRRLAQLELPVGHHLVRADKVSPLVVDRTLRGKLVGPGGKLLDVRVRRESSVRASRPDQERELYLEMERLRRDYLQRYNTGRLADAERNVIARALSDLLQATALESGRGTDRAAEWGQMLDRLEARMAQLEREIRDSQDAAADLAERLEGLAERHGLAQQPTSVYWGSLEAVVEVAQAGRYELAWDYLVPCALWRPSHQAELGTAVRWTLFGTIWQLTGEDWRDVELCLSTARPTLGAELPLLEDDDLHLRPKNDAELQSITVESRDEVIAALSPTDAARLPLVPGVDDGGEARSFELPTPITVPSDGHAHLVELAGFSVERELAYVCCPEISPLVVLRSRQVNGGKHPLLAGPVALIKDGGFMGRSRVSFVAAGERFDLGWGSEDDLQVVRQTEQHSEEVGLPRRTRTRIWVRAYLSNTGRAPRSVQLTERVPVSELDEVKVKIVEKETSAGFRQDRDGHVRWDIELAVEGRSEITLCYDVESSRKVVWR